MNNPNEWKIKVNERMLVYGLAAIALVVLGAVGAPVWTILLVFFSALISG